MKDLAYIETFNRFGSGILFPCKCGKKNTCIIITNYHVIRDLKADGKDKKDDISLEFYDMFGKKVEKEHINAVPELENSGTFHEIFLGKIKYFLKFLLTFSKKCL